jgi:DNA-binding transcriptional ArsR family regulator
VDVFRAIADPIRRELLLRLAEAPARVVDVAASHRVSRPAISKHLRILSDAGLVRAVDQGRERHYSLDTAPLAEVGELLGALTTRQPPISDRHLDALATEVRSAARDRGTAPAAPTRHSRSSMEDIA